jgi:hypothetical protein
VAPAGLGDQRFVALVAHRRGRDFNLYALAANLVVGVLAAHPAAVA